MHFPPGRTEPTLLKHPVSSYGSILLGELIAIKLAVKHIQTNITMTKLRVTETLHIFSDSQCAIGHLFLGWEAKSHKATIQEEKSDIKKLEHAGIKFEISWTPGHSDIQGNEYADQLASSQVFNLSKSFGVRRRLKPFFALFKSHLASPPSSFHHGVFFFYSIASPPFWGLLLSYSLYKCS